MVFQFRLEKALEVKKMEQHLSEIEYTKSIHHFESAAKRLYETLKKKEQLEESYQKKLQAGVHADILHQYDNHLQSLNKLIAKQQWLMQQAKVAMKKKQEAIVDKAVEVKKYTSLKEKRFKEYVASMKKKEQKELDELTLLKLGERHGV